MNPGAPPALLRAVAGLFTLGVSMSRHCTIVAVVLAACFGASARAQNLKPVIDGAIRAMRGLQNADGSYGTAAEQPLATARALQVFGNSPEKYGAQDGPFVRNGVAAMLAHQQPDGGFGPSGAAGRLALTAECLLALHAVAHAGSEEPIAKARAFLMHADAKAIEMEGAGELVAGAIADRRDGYPWAARLRKDAAAPGVEWAKPLGEELAKTDVSGLTNLKPEGIGALCERLLAMIDVIAATGPAAPASPAVPELKLRAVPANAEEEAARVKQALAWLESQQEDGRFGLEKLGDPGITALALSAVMRTCDRMALPRPAYVEPGLAWLLSLQKDDGGIYDKGVRVYVTSVAIEALATANDPKHRAAIDKAAAYLASLQLDETEGYSAEGDPYYGGFGYGSSERPDLSNSQFALQALHDAGVPAGSEAFQKAVNFLERCQNRAENANPGYANRDGTVVVAGTDGGAIYRPGDTRAGTEPGPMANEVIARSYGSMTYALLKSYLFAGLDPKDDRVAAAFDWICRNYTLETNPGFAPVNKSTPYQGLFYYYLTLARALKAYGDGATQVQDGAGGTHDWRAELKAKLFELQLEDGSWSNLRSTRWMEANPSLATAYALLALAEV